MIMEKSSSKILFKKVVCLKSLCDLIFFIKSYYKLILYTIWLSCFSLSIYGGAQDDRLMHVHCEIYLLLHLFKMKTIQYKYLFYR